MIEEIDIRESAPGDWPAVDALYVAAFPEENLLPLVGALLQDGDAVLSLAALRGGALIGHGAFTICGIAGSNARVALLGPLAVAPTAQKRGVGSAIIHAGFMRLEADGVRRIFVLGDPAYYERLGFGKETRVAPPYALPETWRGAWQSVSLGGADPVNGGKLSVPPPWREPALWGP